MKLLITDLDYTIEQGTGVLLARCFGRDEHDNRQIILIEGTRPFFGIHDNTKDVAKRIKYEYRNQIDKKMFSKYGVNK